MKNLLDEMTNCFKILFVYWMKLDRKGTKKFKVSLKKPFYLIFFEIEYRIGQGNLRHFLQNCFRQISFILKQKMKRKNIFEKC